MSVIDSINKAYEKGANADQILLEIQRQNPSKSSVIQEARNRGASSAQIVDEISRQNQSSGIKRFAEGVRDATTSVPRGFGKGAIRTLLGGQQLVERAGTALASGLSRTLTGKELDPRLKRPTALGEKVNQAVDGPLKPKGIGEKIGFGAEQAGEFLLGPSGKARAVQKFLPRVATGVGEFAGRTALQTGGDVESIKEAGVVGGVTEALLPGFSAITGKIAPRLSKTLEKSMLRLTPTQKSTLAPQIERASSFMSKERIVGTPRARFDKVSALYENAESTFQNFVKTKLKNVRISRKVLTDRLEDLKTVYSNERDVLQVEKQIDEVITLLKGRYKKFADVGSINNLKRSTFKNAYNKAGEKVLDDVEHAIGDILKQEIERASGAIAGLKIQGMTLKQFNQRYGDIITARKFLKTAQGRSQAGFFERLAITGAFTGAGLAGGPLAGAGAGIASQGIANQIATPIKSALSSALSSAGLTLSEDAIDKAVRGLVASILAGTRQETSQE